jgi:hypothetical protein
LGRTLQLLRILDESPLFVIAYFLTPFTRAICYVIHSISGPFHVGLSNISQV